MISLIPRIPAFGKLSSRARKPLSQPPATCGGAEVTCTMATAPQPYHTAALRAHCRQGRRQSEAPGSRCCPKNLVHSGYQVFPESGKGRKKKEGTGEGRTREGREARELSKVSVFVCPDL